MLKMDLHAIDAARMMAVAEPEKALEWNMKALDLAEKSADARANKANGPCAVVSGGTISNGENTRKRCSCSRRRCNIPSSLVIRLRPERRNGLLLRFSESSSTLRRLWICRENSSKSTMEKEKGMGTSTRR